MNLYAKVAHEARTDVPPSARRRLASQGRTEAGIATLPSPLATELAMLFRAQPDAIAQLIAEHYDDGTGHCGVCTSGGQVGRSIWPCRLRDLAEQASRRALGGSR